MKKCFFWRSKYFFVERNDQDRDFSQKVIFMREKKMEIFFQILIFEKITKKVKKRKKGELGLFILF